MTFHLMQISEALLASDLEFDPRCARSRRGRAAREEVGSSPGRLGSVVPRSGWCE